MTSTRKIYNYQLGLLWLAMFLLCSCHFKNSADAHPPLSSITTASDCSLMNAVWGGKTCYANFSDIKSKDDCLSAQGVYVASTTATGTASSTTTTADSEVVCFVDVSAIPQGPCVAAAYKWNASSGKCSKPTTVQ